MCLKPGSSIESMHRDAEPGLDPGTDKERRVQSPDELRREIEALRDRISKLSAASLRISSSLDLNTVLREVVESARELTGARYGAITFLDDSRKATVRSQAGSEDGGRGSPPQRSLVPAESAGVRDPAPGSGADGAGDASGLESASFSRAGVASGISGATSGEAIDFRHQSRGDGLEAVVEETGAGVLGAGIVDGGGIGPVEGTETVGISHRKVNLSAGDGPPGRKTVYDWFNRLVFEPIQTTP